MHMMREAGLIILIVVVSCMVGLMGTAVMVWIHPPQEWSIFNAVVDILRVTLASALSSYFTKMNSNGNGNGVKPTS